nr:winged helix-turn-helix domain-containing protein [Desulfurispira natronophila]
MILQVLSKQPSLSLAKVAPLVGKSVRTVERVAARLQKEGKLEHVEPRKGGHWVAKE